MKLIIQEKYHLNRVDIYIRTEQGDKTTIIGYNGKKLVETDITQGVASEKVKPFLSLPPAMFQTVLELFTNEANNRNIRTENENHLKGKLEATQEHLKDLQKAFDKYLSLNFTKIS